MKPSDLCPHFGECGGCQSQDVAYSDQLAAKEKQLRELFGAFWHQDIPVMPSPGLWYYRNKLDFNFGRKFYPELPPKGFQRETVLGFRRKGRWYWPLDIHECRIGSPEMAGLLKAVRGWAKGKGLRAFHSRRGEGFLKILLVREGKRTGQRMVVLITRPGELDGPSFVDTVLSACPTNSVQWAIHHGLAEVAAGDEVTVLHGSSTIEERLRIPEGGDVRELRFCISPFSFFQTNPLASETLYGLIRSWVRRIAPAKLYDLYGGGAGLALTCADLALQVVSVESVESATSDGLRNASLNDVENISFVTQTVEEYLGKLLAAGGMERDSAVIADPPRPGLHPKALRRLLELYPPQIVYVSCKPAVLARELPALLQKYRLRELCAVDMFPHTDHVEAVAWLSGVDKLQVR